IEKFRSENTFPSPILFPDGKKILFRGKEKGHATRVYVQDISGKEPYAITEEGVEHFPYNVSPDGKFFFGIAKDQKIYIFPIESGTPRPIAGISEGEIPFQWSEDGRFVYIRNASLLPVEISRLNPFNGERKLIKKWSPSDSAGVTTGGDVRMTPDEKNFVFSFSRALSNLYMVDGLGRR
ncbi:MAG TPA: hypothetical protein VJ521_14895, partial [Acidobacteriota bacterium]|nr:hypothetical protein [Acidobacteriota bacterium]